MNLGKSIAITGIWLGVGITSFGLSAEYDFAIVLVAGMAMFVTIVVCD